MSQVRQTPKSQPVEPSPDAADEKQIRETLAELFVHKL